MRLGIDFGTTRTVAAAVEKGNYPVCTFSWKGELKEYIPSLVAAKGKTLFFGWDAAELVHDPDSSLLRSIKRLAHDLRPEDPVQIAPEVSLPLMELITLFLVHLKKMLTHHSNLVRKKSADMEVMVATPANANSNQRYLTLEAFRRAGFTVLGAMNEPSAAAVEFAHRYLGQVGPKSPKKYMVVYDLGGGTFDTSAVGLAERNYEVIGHEGIARLGGDDFDEVILELTLEALGISRRLLNGSGESRLLEECRERKEGLKANTRKMVVDPGQALGGNPVLIETAEIYARCEPLVRHTLHKLARVLQGLRDRGIDPEDGRSLAAIYLVGGSVAFPVVARKLRDLYAGKVKTSPFPHAAAAIGLAIAADPDARIKISEAVSRHFGVWRESRQGSEKVFDPIFRKDSRVSPETGRIRITRSYRPMHNIGHFRYMECTALGSDGEPEGDISLWEDAFFPYDPALRDRKDLFRIPVEARPDLFTQEVTETYRYDEEGKVRVEFENRTAGYRKVFDLVPGNTL
ncbi:MAG: Hsp70 family protein [Deltaproteobacteria bacterium]|nr:Hsp70 family protein [Deltaproteobacteria bacterium]